MIAEDKILFGMKNVVLGKPITADVFITNYCNNSCSYCTYGRWKELKKDTRATKYEDFVKYVQRMLELGVKGIILTGGGEPTINPDFDKMVKYLENNQIPYGINTNFNVYKYFEPVFLKVSVDGTNREEYMTKRGVDTFDKVLANIRKYRENAKKHNSCTKVGVQCMAESVEEAKRFCEFWSKEDVDYVVVRPKESIGGDYYLHHNKNEILEYLKSVRDHKILVNYKWFHTEREYGGCPANSCAINVDENGNVCYCCHKPYEIVGNIMDDDILEKKKKFISDFSKCDIPCRLSGPNTIMNHLINDKSEDWCFV